MSIKVDIVSGFLGAGKTTFLNKLIPHFEERIVLIENDFGNVAIDSKILEGDIPVKEINSGCICCSLTMDFKQSIKVLVEEYNPDRIIIEPSGVGMLTDVVKACENTDESLNVKLDIDHLITIVDVSAFYDYMEAFGAFYMDQVRNANIIFLSHIDNVTREELCKIKTDILEINKSAAIFEDNWYEYDGEELNIFLNSLHLRKTDINNINDSRIDADKIFGSYSLKDVKKFTKEEIINLMMKLKEEKGGHIVRAKGFLPFNEGKTIHFDFTPYNYSWDIVDTHSDSMAVIIGCDLKRNELDKLFR